MRLPLCLVCLYLSAALSQVRVRTVGRLQEVFAWKQITFDIQGHLVLQDRYGDVTEEETRQRRQAQELVEPEQVWGNTRNDRRYQAQGRPTNRPNRPATGTGSSSTTTARPADESGRFFIQYNNLPMGAERVGNRLFVTLPRRRYGIPSTLNYIDLSSTDRSPPLRPYPSLREARALTSVYRTRADSCNRLWMVDTGLLEIPDNRQQVQQPAIVIYDLTTDRQMLRYPFKSTDVTSPLSPTGLASITVDIQNGDCDSAYAYIPELATYGLIVFSLRDNDSWRLSHNYFSFDPTAGNLNIAGQRFQWNDGIFSVALTGARADGCRTAYFHPMVSTKEFSVSTCVLTNKTASTDSNYWAQYSVVGDRGANSHSNMHGYHEGTQVMFFADIARDAVSCWYTGNALSSASVEILGRDSMRLSYPSDLHVSGDELWVMANSLPRWAYSTLDINEYSFYVYKAKVQDMIRGTVCEGRIRPRSGDIQSEQT